MYAAVDPFTGLASPSDLLADLMLHDADVAIGVMPCSEQEIAAFGATLGTADMREAGREANRYPPELRLFDRAGRRFSWSTWTDEIQTIAARITYGDRIKPRDQKVAVGH